MTEDLGKLYVNHNLIDTAHNDPFEHDESSLSLSEIIPRIIKERGSILNVTEESLLNEISLLEARNGSGEQVEEEPQEILSEEGPSDDGLGHADELLNQQEDGTVSNVSDLDGSGMTMEEFMEEKNEILKLLRSALNESSLSLDFVSLLISCVRPAAGSISMSPHLKQFVPTGTLNSSSVQISEADREQRKTDYEKEAKTGQGWKLQSLEYSAQLLKNSSTRLAEEVSKEKAYWNKICEIVKSNEVLVKIQSSGSTGSNVRKGDIGVKYGFGDSGSNYFDKGMGILKKNAKNGEVQFSPIRNNNFERTNKIVKVKILQRIDDELTVVSQTDVKAFYKKSLSSQNDDNDDIGTEISKARFYLFEEELFHELMREATTLISYQVQVISNKITIDMNNEIIQIEAVSLDEEEDEIEDEDDQEIRDSNSNGHRDIEGQSLSLLQKTTDSSRADHVASFLRLMLCQEHRANVRQKYRTPRPRQDARLAVRADFNLKRPALLMRPLIGHSRHEHYIRQLRKICLSLATKFYSEESKQKASLAIVKYDNISASELKKNEFVRCTKVPRSKLVFVIDSLKNATKRLKFEIGVINTSGYCNIVLNVKTFWLGQEKNIVDVNFSEFIDVEDSLDWAIRSYE